MTEQNTYDWIKRELETVMEDHGVQEDRAFEIWVLKTVHGLDEDAAYDATDTLRGFGGGDGGIDGFWKDSSAREVNLWQCKWSEKGPQSFDRTAGSELINAAQALMSEDSQADYGSKFQDMAATLQNSLKSGYSLFLNLAVAGEMSSRTKRQIEDAVRETLQPIVNNIVSEKGARVSLEIWELSRFQEQYEEEAIGQETLKSVSIPFALQSGSLIDLADTNNTIPDGWKAAVVSLNAKELGKIAGEYKSQLFDLNVRFSLSRNKRIRKISETLQDVGESKFFWLYNNGITMLCDGFSIANGSDHSITIDNPQVVNGCQTVTTLRREWKTISESVAVLTRVIVPPTSDDAQQQSLKIAEYTNNQNPVLSRDLRSNDLVHKKLKVRFEQWSPPYFYERKRGEWNSLTSSQKSKFRDDSGVYRKFDCERIGQSFRMTYQPAEALYKKKDLFDDDDVYNQVFNVQRAIESYLFAEQLRSKFDTLFKGEKLDDQTVSYDRLVQYTSGAIDELFARKMARAKGQLVSHSVALTVKLLQGEGKLRADVARRGLESISDFNKRYQRWSAVILSALSFSVEKASDNNEDFNLKKHFERPDGRMLEELWVNIKKVCAPTLGERWEEQYRGDLFGRKE